MQHERADDRGRDGQRGDDRAAQVAQEQQHDQRRQDRAQDQVLLDRVDAGADGLGVVADDAAACSRPAACGSSSFMRSRRASTTATVFAPDCLRTDSTTAGSPSMHGRGLGLLLPVDDRADVARPRSGGRRRCARRSSPSACDVWHAAAARARSAAAGPVSTAPPGVVRFWATMARCTSTAVRPAARSFARDPAPPGSAACGRR